MTAAKFLPTGKVPLSRSYDGEAGVQDTAEEVRALRQQGVRVAAVFMGENASAPDARTIYGQDLVRIQRMDQLATAAGKLIQEEIRAVRVSMCKYIVKVIIFPCRRHKKEKLQSQFSPFSLSKKSCKMNSLSATLTTKSYSVGVALEGAP